MLDVVLNRLLTAEFVGARVEEVNSQLNALESAARIAHLEGRPHSLNRTISNLLDLGEKVGGVDGVSSRLKQRKEEKERVQEELRLLEAGQEQVLVPRETVEGLLAEMRQPLANGTLEAQRAILQSTVDRLVVERQSAELYYQFPCAALYKVPPARLERAHTASEAAALSA